MSEELGSFYGNGMKLSVWISSLAPVICMAEYIPEVLGQTWRSVTRAPAHRIHNPKKTESASHGEALNSI